MKHVETETFDQEEYVLVTMTYRGTNSFGPIVPSSISAKLIGIVN